MSEMEFMLICNEYEKRLITWVPEIPPSNCLSILFHCDLSSVNSLNSYICRLGGQRPGKMAKINHSHKMVPPQTTYIIMRNISDGVY